MPSDSEAALILVGHLTELNEPISEFVRLRRAENLFPDELAEIQLPVRFIFILLIPHDHYENEAENMGRCMATLMVDEVTIHHHISSPIEWQ